MTSVGRLYASPNCQIAWYCIYCIIQFSMQHYSYRQIHQLVAELINLRMGNNGGGESMFNVDQPCSLFLSLPPSFRSFDLCCPLSLCIMNTHSLVYTIFTLYTVYCPGPQYTVSIINVPMLSFALRKQLQLVAVYWICLE